jgi:hypothetical protein
MGRGNAVNLHARVFGLIAGSQQCGGGPSKVLGIGLTVQLLAARLVAGYAANEV